MGLPCHPLPAQAHTCCRSSPRNSAVSGVLQGETASAELAQVRKPSPPPAPPLQTGHLNPRCFQCPSQSGRPGWPACLIPVGTHSMGAGIGYRAFSSSTQGCVPREGGRNRSGDRGRLSLLLTWGEEARAAPRTGSVRAQTPGLLVTKGSGLWWWAGPGPLPGDTWGQAPSKSA